MNGKRSIKKSERNTPVRKSIRLRKAKVLRLSYREGADSTDNQTKRRQ